MDNKTGVLLVNLGTPDEPNRKKVGTYLREFLSDPFVIDIPALIRFFLVNFIIVPFRAKKSAQLYKKIWMENGSSPLLFHSRNLSEKLQTSLGESYSVKLAMRYGNPSIKTILGEFSKDGVSKIKVVPLFPHYALATYESAVKKVEKEARKFGHLEKIDFLAPYYKEDGFIGALVESARNSISKTKPDHILFTYHGLPVRHVKKTEILKSGEASKCASFSCCDKITERNKNCYRAQCFETSRLVASKLGLEKADYTTCFQSRFGKDPWIEPFTDFTLDNIKENFPDISKVLVISPSFATDCLETLEEIGIGLKADFEAKPNESRRELLVDPCLNDSDTFVSYLSSAVKK
jgi:ferrochelatase